MYKPYICPYCGTQIFEDSQYCPVCGTYIWPEIPESFTHKTDYLPSQYSKEPIISVVAIIIIVLIIISILSLVFIGPLGIQNNEDNALPTVVRTEPADMATDVPPLFNLKIFFNVPMNRSNSIHNALLGINISQAKSRWIDDKTVEITNLIAFEFGINYVYFNMNNESGIKDRKGNYLEDEYHWAFTTRLMNVDVLSTTIFRDHEVIYIYGEVKNRENFYVNSIGFKVTAIDSNHNSFVIDWLSIYTTPFKLGPNETVPFIGFYWDKDMIVEDMVVEIANDASIELEPRYEGLVIIKEEEYYEYYGGKNHHIVNVTVRNEGDRLARWVTASVTLYDSSGEVVCVSDYDGITDLDVGDSIDMEIWTFENECDLNSIDSYSIIVHELM